jgi:hypothetical protein
MSTTTQDPRVGDVAVPSGTTSPRPRPRRQLPSLAIPAAVEQARAAHERVADRYADHKGAVKAAEAELEQAQADDIRDDAALVAAGKRTLAEVKREGPKAEAKLAEAKRDLTVLAEAARQTERALGAAVLEHRDGWLAELEQREGQAARACATAITDLRKATSELAAASGARRWLDQASERDPLPLGGSTDKLRVRLGSTEHHLPAVLDALAGLVEPESDEEQQASSTSRSQPRRRKKRLN